MVDTAGTAIQAADALMRDGAESVTLCCTHGVLSGNAIKKINDSDLDEVIISDTINPSKEAINSKKIRVLSISELLGEAIKRIVAGESISVLFN